MIDVTTTVFTPNCGFIFKIFATVLIPNTNDILFKRAAAVFMGARTHYSIKKLLCLLTIKRRNATKILQRHSSS